MAEEAVTAFGVPPPLVVSSDDDETTNPRPPPTPLPTHLFGFAVKKVLKRNLLALVADKFSLYSADAPTTPPVPAVWSDEEEAAEAKEAAARAARLAAAERALDGSDDGDDDGDGAAASLSTVGASSDSESDDGSSLSVASGLERKPSWLANAINAATESDDDDAGAPSGEGARAGLPEYFRDAGTDVGLEIWRIVAGTPTRISADEYGTFYKGDAYIVLGTDEVEYSKTYSLFFWIGDAVPLNQTLAASFAAQELGRAVGARAIRQTMGDESKKFRELLWFGIEYVDGGSSAGLRKVVKKAKVALYQIKGSRKPKVCKLPLALSSLNASDVFLLDAETVLYQWNGDGASMREKGKALDMFTFIKSDERSGKLDQVILSHAGPPGSPLTPEELAFFTIIAKAGAHPPTSEPIPDFEATGMPVLAPETETDAEFEARVVDAIKLHRVHESSSGKLSLELAGEGLLRRSALDPDAAFVLDSATGIYAWVGRGSSETQRAAAVQIAKLYHAQQERPAWQPVERVVEGAEPFLFQESFRGWHRAKARAKRNAVKHKFEARKAAAAAARARAATVATHVPSLLAASPPPIVDTVTDDPGGGKLTVMVLESDVVQYVLPQSLYGHFYTLDVFLVIYYYQTEETATEPATTKCVIYFWEGSGADKRVWLGFQHSALKERLEEAMQPAVFRMRESRESPHFRSLFNGLTLVHYGHLSSYVPLPVARLLPSEAPAFAARFSSLPPDANFNASSLLPPSAHLWHVKGFGPGQIFVHETPLMAPALDSNDAFVALAPDKGAYVWIGRHASDDEVATAKYAAHEVVALVNTLQLASLDADTEKDEFILSRIVVVKEEAEPEEWWNLFGGRALYDTPSDPDFAPRLYRCAATNDGFVVNFVTNTGLSFEDLEPRTVFLLDIFARIFVWVGQGASSKDVAMAKDVALEYVESALDGRGGCPVTTVAAGEESLLFKKQFLDWPHTSAGSASASTSFVDPRQAREAELKAQAALRAKATAAAIAARHCTIRATSFELLVVQTWRQCVTCGLEGDLVGACESCAAVCHAGHTLSDPRTEYFFCSCGPSLVEGVPPCACLPPESAFVVDDALPDIPPT